MSLSALFTITDPVSLPPPPDGVHLRNGIYRIDAYVDQRGAVSWFEGVRQDTAHAAAVRIAREPISHAERSAQFGWPSIGWEVEIRARAQHLGIPRIIDQFVDGQHLFLVIEDPIGVSLWDAWDDPAVDLPERYGWLLNLADTLRALHRAAAIVEGLRPDQVRVTPVGQVVLTADVVLLPLPPPNGPNVRPGIGSAPELHRLGPVDARADLYHFGSVLYALELGRELTPLDFDAPAELKPVLARLPEIHPCLGRILARTLAVERNDRFPSDDGGNNPSGFGELVRTLERAQRLLGRARLEIASWTSTGMLRRNNEDALTVVQASELRDAVTDDWAFIGLADGMGGNAAGEVAAALTIHTLRHSLFGSAPLRGLRDDAGALPGAFEPETIAEAIATGLRDANRAVHVAGRCDGRQGMGCTAEAVFVDGRQVVVGHVGDSRTYLFHRSVLTQLTRDQTMLTQMIDQGQITPDEARRHPRRGELAQAIGGRADVEPELVRAAFGPGDWLIVCSDGLPARVAPEEIAAILGQSNSADSAARRLINRANLEGAADNVSVVVVRGC
jgi:serine/threonine protein phosphatase PrpC